MNRLEGLVEFLAVVEAKSFSTAARKLGMSIAQMSRRVAALEERLGTKLLIRTTRNVSLTPAGEQLALRSRPLIEELSVTQDSVLMQSDAVEGLIRLSLGGHFAEQQVVASLATFCAAYPLICLEVNISNRKVDLLDGYFDFAILAGPVEDSTAIVARPLARVPMVTVANAELVQRLEDDLGGPLTPLTVPPDRCLSLCGWQWRFRRGEEVRVIEPRGPFASNSAYLLIGAASAGLGVAHVPVYDMSIAHRAYRLAAVFGDWSTEDIGTFNIVYVRNRFMPSRVRLLIEHLLSSSFGRRGAACAAPHRASA